MNLFDNPILIEHVVHLYATRTFNFQHGICNLCNSQTHNNYLCTECYVFTRSHIVEVLKILKQRNLCAYTKLMWVVNVGHNFEYCIKCNDKLRHGIYNSFYYLCEKCRGGTYA